MRQENAFKIRLIKLLEILRQHSDEDNYSVGMHNTRKASMSEHGYV